MQATSLAMGENSRRCPRGEVAEDGTVSAPCSTEFLLTLHAEFMKARAFEMVKIVKVVTEDQQLERLQFLLHELRRLLHHPRLFRTTALRARFISLLSLDASLQFDQSCNGLLVEAELRKVMQASRKNKTKKSYLDGSRAWENFLLDGAPGTGYHVVETYPKSAFQVIPAVGLRIVGEFEREEGEIVRYVENHKAPLDVQVARTTMMINFDKTTPADELLPDLRLNQQTQTTHISPNPFCEDERIFLPLVSSMTEPLESFPIFMNRLEQPPPPPQALAQVLNAPNIFPIATLRSWHPPRKLWQLRFLR